MTNVKRKWHFPSLPIKSKLFNTQFMVHFVLSLIVVVSLERRFDLWSFAMQRKVDELFENSFYSFFSFPECLSTCNMLHGTKSVVTYHRVRSNEFGR